MSVLIPVFIATALTAVADEDLPELVMDDVNRNELNNNADEPQIALPEVVGKKNPFRTVSQGIRKESKDPLVRLTQNAVDTTARRLLSTDKHTPWQMMHALLGLRHDFNLMHNGQTINGLDWIAEGQSFDNEYWFEKTSFGGRAHPYNQPYAFEGHANQFVAILSMCGVDLDREFGTPKGAVTMRDMIEHAKMSIDTKIDEPTWTLWALSRYLPPDAKWRNHKGEMWSIERLVQDQTQRPMKGAPCGGTHSLFALAHARNVYLRQGQPLRGVWLQAEYKIRKYIQTARVLQNSNGSLSSNYFRGRQYNPDFNKRMASAGHVLEFLMIALPQEELKALWVRRAIEATSNDLLKNRKAYVKCSPLYHSVNALNIYLDRVNPRGPASIASQEEPSRTAMLTPKRLQEPRAALKGVPAIGIAQSRELPAVEPKTSPETATEPTIASETKTAAVPVLTEKSMEAAIVRDSEKWTSTPKERRSPITVPEAKVNERAIEMKATPVAETPVAKTPIEESQPAEIQPAEKAPKPEGVEEPEAVEAAEEPKTESNEEANSSTETETEPATEPSSTTTNPYADTQTEPAQETTAETSAQPSTEATTEPETTTEPEATTEQQSEAPASEPTTSESTAKETVAAPEPAEATESVENDTQETTAPSEETDAEEAKDIAEGAMTESEPATDAESDAEVLVETEVPVKTVSVPRKLDVPDATSITSKSHLNENRATVHDDINDEFLDPNLNPKDWVRRFETQSREIAAERAAIVATMGLRYGHWVADIGAGTGLFMKPMSNTVGRRGRVFAVDISPRLVEHLEGRAVQERATNVKVVHNSGQSLDLGGNRLHKAFVCDTYHHFEHPQEMLDSIYHSLLPGGELILVDFERNPETSREWVLDIVRADKQTFRTEIESAGFQFVDEVSIPGLTEHYVLRFRRPRR